MSLEMSFDHLAPHYRWMEAVLAGGVLQRARLRWLDMLKERRSLLIVGEGPGRCLEILRRMYPNIPVTVVEASARMIAVAKERLQRKGISCDGVTWVQRDVRTWAAEMPEAGYDVAITPFVLDCFSPIDVARVIHTLADRVLVRDSDWLLMDFRMPPRGWRYMRGRLAHALMYRFFRAVTRLEARSLTAPDALFIEAGFQIEGRAFFNAGLIHSDHWRRKS